MKSHAIHAVLLAGVLSLLTLTPSVHANTLIGSIMDDSGRGLASATVSIPALKRGAISDESGAYRITDVPHGVYTVAFSLIGYASETRSVDLYQPEQDVSVTLRISTLPLRGVTVTATPQPSSPLESSQATSSIDGRQLDRERGETVMKAIESSPGVALYTTGAGIAKPVIRGLTSQRVLVVVGGVRQEGQQWGDEHAPEIDAMNVERIEVVRGPASVLYGSDAVGGVVNVIPKELPSAEEGASPLSGEITGNAFSNNSQGAGSLALYGAQAGGFGYRGNIGLRSSDDIRTPDGKLFNSGEEETNGSGALGWRGAKGAGSVDYAHFDSKLEIHEDPAEEEGATPFQKVRHDRIHGHGLLPLAHARVELDAGWRRNNRREFEEADASDPSLDLILKTITADLRVHHHPVELLNGTIGVAVMKQDNKSLAEEKLIPDYDLADWAGYIYEEARLDKVTLSAGARVDNRTMDISESEDLGVESQERDYSAFTANGGIVFRVAPGVAVTGSIGRAWRAPTPFELFVNGVHEGTVRFEIGNSDLDPEISLNLESGIRYLSPNVRLEATVFRNAIDQFIYLSPTGETDPESGFGVFQNRQADAVLTGAEVFAEAVATKWLAVRGGVDLVRGNNEETDRPLPLIPANRIQLGATVSRNRLGSILSPYASVDVKIIADQSRIEEFETETSGYTLVHLGAGLEVPIGTHRMSIDAGVENLLDESYHDHLSRYKEYALNPGRNITLKVSVPFTLAP